MGFVTLDGELFGVTDEAKYYRPRADRLDDEALEHEDMTGGRLLSELTHAMSRALIGSVRSRVIRTKYRAQHLYNQPGTIDNLAHDLPSITMRGPAFVVATLELRYGRDGLSFEVRSAMLCARFLRRERARKAVAA